MRNDGKKKAISPGSGRGQRKSNGKKADVGSRQQRKTTAKYTIVRNNQDIEQLEKLRRILKDVYGHSRYNTDAEIYRDLPQLYLDAVKKGLDVELINEELTAKLDQLEDLRSSICRILEFCKVKK